MARQNGTVLSLQVKTANCQTLFETQKRNKRGTKGQEKSFSDRNNRGSDGGRLNEQFAKLDPATAFKSRGERASYENFPNQTVAPQSLISRDHSPPCGLADRR